LTNEAESLFEVACYCVVGKGDKALFWTDSWLEGKSPKQIAPTLLNFVKARRALQRTVAEALNDSAWIADIRGVPSLQAISEFIIL
jgi:hypothetical protein